MESQVTRLVKFGLGMLVDLPNFDLESKWTCQIGLEKSCHKNNMHHHTYHIAHSNKILHIAHNILHVAHNILNIEHNIFHIIRSYAMRPWNHGLNIKTSQK